MEFNEALEILNENDYIVEDFSTQDMKNFKYVFKIDKMDKLFSIESDSVFRGGFSFWIVSKKNPNERYLIRTHSNVIEQYIRPNKTGEVKYGDGYDIILTLKHYMETQKLVGYIHGKIINESMEFNEAKQILKENGFVMEGYDHYLNRFRQMNAKREKERNRIKDDLIKQIIADKSNDFTEEDYDDLFQLNVRQLKKLLNV